jgi:ABC-type amino acid transport substrate-binding protein
MHDEDNRFYGLDVELAREIADELGVEVVFKRSAQTFGEIIDILVKQEADVAITLLSRTLNRSMRVRFTRPYLTLRQGLLVNRLKTASKRKNQELIEALNQPNVKIGVKYGTSYVDFAYNLFKQAMVVTYQEWDPDLIKAVLSGEIHAAFHDEIEIKKVIAGKPDIALKLQPVIMKDTKDPIAMAVPWDSQHLLSWLNLYIESANLDLDADKLLSKYAEIFKKPNAYRP